ncbi:MAG: hypothetical protein CM15mP95_2960 [Alphaproteobacteria bacterium]|nr:MAG: hypothetical protein CM15mP95_2960 [Alphaproteobacteria bacterium]
MAGGSGNVGSPDLFLLICLFGMPFYSGEPWFLPLAMRFYACKTN